jgi:hypothetical protein
MGAGKRAYRPSDVFEIIKRAKDNRVPIVPLIGAGLSLEAGVPTTPLMIDYMVKVKLLIDLGHRHDHEDMDYARHLKAGGWPDPDELNDLVLVGLQRWLHHPHAAPEWLGDLVDPENGLVWTSGSLLGAVRPFTLHEYLQRVQPSLLGFLPRTGRCPVMTTITDDLARAFSRSEHADGGAGRGDQADPASSGGRAGGGDWDELLERVGRAIWKNLGDTSSFERRREQLGTALRAELKRSGLRDRILRELELDWRAILRLLTSGIPSLVDSFFARVLRGHKPAIGHQLLGLMAETLGAKLWLTTNFDDLIERALRDQSIHPDVYELPDRGPAPDASLLRCGPAVVKLHGSGFALRVGESLDTPLDEANLQRFKAYFPNDAIVLVIGYGGGDHRVMSLIEQLVIDHKWESQRLPKVIWVHRDAPIPDAVERASKGTGEEEAEKGQESIVTVRYRSGGLFLREMYELLSRSHPASRVAYDALPMLPPRRPADRGGEEPGGRAGIASVAPTSPPGRPAEDSLDSPVTLIHGRKMGSGTSTFLVNRVNALAGTH